MIKTFVWDIRQVFRPKKMKKFYGTESNDKKNKNECVIVQVQAVTWIILTSNFTSG